ncbi:hypothetical protein AB1N83_010457, partial [Pleurotus pulmonarius]
MKVIAQTSGHFESCSISISTVRRDNVYFFAKPTDSRVSMSLQISVLYPASASERRFGLYTLETSACEVTKDEQESSCKKGLLLHAVETRDRRAQLEAIRWISRIYLYICSSCPSLNVRSSASRRRRDGCRVAATLNEHLLRRRPFESLHRDSRLRSRVQNVAILRDACYILNDRAGREGNVATVDLAGPGTRGERNVTAINLASTGGNGNVAAIDAAARTSGDRDIAAVDIAGTREARRMARVDGAGETTVRPKGANAGEDGSIAAVNRAAGEVGIL